MKEIKFIPLNLKKKPNIFIIYLFLNIIRYCLFETCNNRDNPYLFNGKECVKSCEEEKIKSNICILDNEIIKTQYLNNIIHFKEEHAEYFNFEISEENNLYYYLSEYPKSNVRILYMLNNEGYGLLNRNDPIYNNNINDPSTSGRYESDIFTFHLLSDTNNKEYLLSLGKSNSLMEVYDFHENNTYFIKTCDFFLLSNIFSIVGTHIKLKNKKNNYIIGLLAHEYTSGFV